MIILLGKTCSGKDTIRKELIKLGYEPVITYTTRPIRDGEIDGVTYHFISKEEFLQKELEGFFAETTSYNVATGETWYYGSAIEDLTKNKVIIANPDGVKKFKQFLDLNPIVFFLSVEEEDILNRLKLRGDNTDEALRRLKADESDFLDIDKYVDFSIKNDGNIGSTPDANAALINLLYKTKVGETN